MEKAMCQVQLLDVIWDLILDFTNWHNQHLRTVCKMIYRLMKNRRCLIMNDKMSKMINGGEMILRNVLNLENVKTLKFVEYGFGRELFIDLNDVKLMIDSKLEEIRFKKCCGKIIINFLREIGGGGKSICFDNCRVDFFDKDVLMEVLGKTKVVRMNNCFGSFEGMVSAVVGIWGRVREGEGECMEEKMNEIKELFWNGNFNTIRCDAVFDDKFMVCDNLRFEKCAFDESKIMKGGGVVKELNVNLFPKGFSMVSGSAGVLSFDAREIGRRFVESGIMDGLRVLELEFCCVGMWELGHLKCLNKLVLKECAGLEKLDFISGMDGLESLEINGCENVQDEGFVLGKKCRNLEIINCKKLCSIGFVGGDSFSNLRALSMRGMGPLLGCHELGTLRNLEKLRLNGWNLSEIKFPNSLRSLNISSTTLVKSRSFQCEFAMLEGLREFIASGCMWLDGDFLELISAYIPNLHILNIRYCQFIDNISCVLHFKKLIKLNMCGIKFESLESELRKLQELRYLRSLILTLKYYFDARQVVDNSVALEHEYF